MKKIALIGCTGSIGRQVVSVVRRYPQEFAISALVAGANGEELARLCEAFTPKFAALASGAKFSCPDGTTALYGEDILEHIFDGCDVALIAASGFAGLSYTLKAASLGKQIALANKESLVCGGELVSRALEKTGADLVPVDSEHSALWQALSFRRNAPFAKLVLTASGGPFRQFTEEQLARVRAEDALKHPTWNMGAKITIDSATLLNKGYEVIEAKWLYGADFSQIKAIVHPESIVHSLVYFEDGAALAQMGYPTMEVPIQLALTYPKRLPCAPMLDLEELGALRFERLQEEKFPCYSLAIEAGKEGGVMPTALNGAAEEAVYAFLKGGITFPQIAETIKCVLNSIPNEGVESFAQLQNVDVRARQTARQFIYGK